MNRLNIVIPSIRFVRRYCLSNFIINASSIKPNSINNAIMRQQFF
jgi:hypothetical protein